MKTLYELLDEYIEHIRSLNYSRTRQFFLESKAFLDFVENHYKAVTADQLRNAHLFSWQKHLDEHRTAKSLPLKAASINKRIRCLRSFLRHLVLKGYILKNLLEAISNVKEPSMLPLGVFTHAKIRRVLSKMDISTTEGRRDRAMLELMYSSGIRAGEVQNLNLESFDPENETVTVFGKNRKERVVPVGKTALRHLETYIKGVRPFLEKDRKERAFFLNTRGGRLMYWRILAVVHKYCDKEDMGTKVTPHTFRRSCTTELIRGNANLYHVKELLGHEALDTLTPYIKLTITDLKKTHAKCHPREKDKN